jgi:hypothetical protein
MNKPLTRAETKKAISDLPIERVLQIKNSTLTARQKQFAKAVAEGSTGADAYRQAYSKNGKKKTHGDNASRLKRDERIQAEIAAHAMALELQKYRSAEGLRALALSSLVEVLIDAESKPAHKLQAARIIGQVTEVALFTTRSEVKHINDSGEIKEKIIAQIKSLMLSAGGAGDVTDVAANDLLAELSASDDMISAAHDERKTGADDGEDFLADDEPHRTPSPPELNEPPPRHIHTIPHEPPPEKTTPMHFRSDEGGGDIFLEKTDT